MKRTFRLEGLDCANCSAKIERAINELDGVNTASVNLITTKLVIEGEEEKMSHIISTSEKIVKKFEPHVIFKRA